MLQPSPSSRGSRWMWFGGVLGLLLAVGMFRSTYAARDEPEPTLPSLPSLIGAGETFMVSGGVVLGDPFTKDGQGGCAGSGPHAAVVEGAPVVITTGAGAVAGELAVPQALDDGTCRFSFSVSGVPAGEDAYLVTVAGQDVGNCSEAELNGTLVSIRVD